MSDDSSSTTVAIVKEGIAKMLPDAFALVGYEQAISIWLDHVPPSVEPTDKEIARVFPRLMAVISRKNEQLAWLAQVVHQAHHGGHEGPWQTCPAVTCQSVAKELAEQFGFGA